jgi:hypothetical protein
MNRKFKYCPKYKYEYEVIELLSINVVPKIELYYEGLELKIVQQDTYRIIFIDKYNEIIEEELDRLLDLKVI